MSKRVFQFATHEIALDVDRPPQSDIPQIPAGPALEDATKSGSSHPAPTIAIHWMTVVALVIAVAVMFVRDANEDRAWRQFLLDAHRQLGLLVLLGAGVRIAIRLRRGLADHAPGMAPLLRWVAKAAHVLMYAVLIALPLFGWAVTSAHGIGLTFLGTVPLPKLLSSDSELADTLSDYHVWLAWGLLALVVTHIAAAIWHHFVRRDGVLRAMLPKAFGRRT
jgi:cytochrome b561